MRLSASIGSRSPVAPTAVGNALLTTSSDTEIATHFTGPSTSRDAPTTVCRPSMAALKVRRDCAAQWVLAVDPIED